MSRPSWTAGFACAVAILAREEGPLATCVLELLGAGCPTLEKALAYEVDPDDIATLTPSWEFIQRQMAGIQ